MPSIGSDLRRSVGGVTGRARLACRGLDRRLARIEEGKAAATLDVFSDRAIERMLVGGLAGRPILMFPVAAF